MSNGNGHSWSKFFWRDWRQETGLKLCSLAARGLWMELLCIMHEGTPIGHLAMHGKPMTHRQIALFVGGTEREVRKYEAELEKYGVFSRTEAGVIFCRRMAREAAAEAESKEAWRAHGANGGNPTIIRGTVVKAERQRPYRRSDSPQKTERIFQRDAGCCHWCGVPLVRENPLHPNFFHVDHILAVRDGGGVDEANLVAACQRCNMRRARHDNETPSDNNPAEIPTATSNDFRQQGSEASDSNPQKLEADSDPEAKKEDKKELINSSLSYPCSAREDPEPPPAARLAVENVVARVASALESSGKKPNGRAPKMSAIQQQVAIIRGPVLDDEAPPPDAWERPRRGPADPIRSVAEQLAILRGEAA